MRAASVLSVSLVVCLLLQGTTLSYPGAKFAATLGSAPDRSLGTVPDHASLGAWHWPVAGPSSPQAEVSSADLAQRPAETSPNYAVDVTWLNPQWPQPGLYYQAVVGDELTFQPAITNTGTSAIIAPLEMSLSFPSARLEIASASPGTAIEYSTHETTVSWIRASDLLPGESWATTLTLRAGGPCHFGIMPKWILWHYDIATILDDYLPFSVGGGRLFLPAVARQPDT